MPCVVSLQADTPSHLMCNFFSNLSLVGILFPTHLLDLCLIYPSCFCVTISYDIIDMQVERLLSAEQKATDYRSPDDGIAPDHRPTNACTRYIKLN